MRSIQFDSIEGCSFVLRLSLTKPVSAIGMAPKRSVTLAWAFKIDTDLGILTSGARLVGGIKVETERSMRVRVFSSFRSQSGEIAV
jgi:hypothetical protein